MRVRVADLARVSSGASGDTVNIGVIARRKEDYQLLARHLTPERVLAWFAGRVRGPVERYEAPNLGALNFVLHGALGGGASLSLRSDAEGRGLAAALLRMEIDTG
jgi:hypothetical protein